MRKTISVLTLCAALAGCAANSGIVSMEGDTYFVSRQAATGFPGMGNLKAEALTEANQYCESQQKTMKVLQADETKPPYILGNYPKIEVQFTCIYNRPKG